MNQIVPNTKKCWLNLKIKEIGLFFSLALTSEPPTNSQIEEPKWAKIKTADRTAERQMNWRNFKSKRKPKWAKTRTADKTAEKQMELLEFGVSLSYKVRRKSRAPQNERKSGAERIH